MRRHYRAFKQGRLSQRPACVRRTGRRKERGEATHKPHPTHHGPQAPTMKDMKREGRPQPGLSQRRRERREPLRSTATNNDHEEHEVHEEGKRVTETVEPRFSQRCRARGGATYRPYSTNHTPQTPTLKREGRPQLRSLAETQRAGSSGDAYCNPPDGSLE